MGRRRSGFGNYTRVRIEPCMAKLWEKPLYRVERLGGKGPVEGGLWTWMTLKQEKSIDRRYRESDMSKTY